MYGFAFGFEGWDLCLSFRRDLGFGLNLFFGICLGSEFGVRGLGVVFVFVFCYGTWFGLCLGLILV